MTSLKLQAHTAQPRRRRAFWLESFLLCAGLIAVDAYIWVEVQTTFTQAYDSYSLDEQLQRRTPSWSGFISRELGSAKPQKPPEPEPEISTPRQARPEAQELLGRIDIPRLRLNATVREGVDDSTLRVAVGHMPSTALPGMPGNVALAAHRDTLFRKLRDIRKSDRITFETTQGSYEYVVESLSVVKPTDVSVLKAKQGDQLLTLITCYPFNYVGAAPNRFIVRARQVNLTAKATRPA